MKPRVVVVGGGISGLSTAYFIQEQLGDRVELILLESSERLGGKAYTRSIAGLAVDTGPDAFLSRAPQLAKLIDSLGLRSKCVSPATSGAYVWSRGKLRALPPGANFGLPEKVVPLVRNGLISLPGGIRALADLFLPKRKLESDFSVGDLLRPRFGTEVYQRMVEPMLGGVHAGDAALLSAPSTVPEIASLAKSTRSLLLGLRKRKATMPKPATKPGAALISFDGGISTLTDTLAERLGEATVRTSTKVVRISRAADKFNVEVEGESFQSDHVVLATPAYISAELVSNMAPTLADQLVAIPYVDSQAVILAFRKGDIPALPSGTGFLIPPVESEFIVGVTWLTSKWPQLVNDDVVVIRNLVGRFGDSRWTEMTNDEVVERVCEGLRRMMKIEARPIESVLQPWPKAMPQYVVGHGKRLEAIDHELASLSGLHLVGAAYRGVGLAGCVASAAVLAEKIVNEMKANYN